MCVRCAVFTFVLVCIHVCTYVHQHAFVVFGFAFVCIHARMCVVCCRVYVCPVDICLSSCPNLSVCMQGLIVCWLRGPRWQCL